MGILRRLRDGLARVFGTGRPRPARGDSDTGGITGDSFTPEGEMPSGWSIYATSPGGGIVDPYTGGDLPAYTHTIASRIIVGKTDASGTIHYRTVHGPVRDIDQLIDLIIRVIVVVSPV